MHEKSRWRCISYILETYWRKKRMNKRKRDFQCLVFETKFVQLKKYRLLLRKIRWGIQWTQQLYWNPTNKLLEKMKRTWIYRITDQNHEVFKKKILKLRCILKRKIKTHRPELHCNFMMVPICFSDEFHLMMMLAKTFKLKTMANKICITIHHCIVYSNIE